MIRNTQIYKIILEGQVSPDITVNLENAGEIQLVTVGDTAFPRLSWLLKCYSEDTKNPQQRYFS